MDGRHTSRGSFYSPLPVSYYVDPDWKRINWNGAAQAVQVVDNKDRQEVYVFAPLDSSTVPSHILMWDYSNGTSPEQVKYSRWNIVGYLPGSGCIVQNPSTQMLELWIGDSASGPVGRQMNAADTLPYRDFGGPIDWQYETALMPGLTADMGRIYYHYALQFRALGAGSLHTTVYGMDRLQSQAISNLTLAASPGQVYTKRYPRLRSESASIRFTINATDQWCQVSAVDHYFGQGPSYR